MASVASSVVASGLQRVSSEEKWDHSLENFLRKCTIGFAVGILPALLLARSNAVRNSIVALCTGVGSGVAYGEAWYLFNYDIMFDQRHLVQVKLEPPVVKTE